MNRHLLVHLVVVTLVVVAAASCRDTTAPPEAALKGTYFVADVNGAPLPADISFGEPGRLILLSETIRFDGAGGAMDDVTQRDSLSNTPAQVVFASVKLSYQVDGSVVHFKVLCGPGAASCVSLPDATIVDAKDLVIHSGAYTLGLHNPL